MDANEITDKDMLSLFINIMVFRLGGQVVITDTEIDESVATIYGTSIYANAEPTSAKIILRTRLKDAPRVDGLGGIEGTGGKANGPTGI